MKFLDQAKIYVKGGDGGNGAASFRREKFVEFGGPDGGDGGRGGDVMVEAVDGLNTLIDYRYRQHVKAQKGRPGAGSNRSGASGRTVELQVPVGTQIFEEDGETLVADLTEVGARVVLAAGGQGGQGNTRYKSSTNQAPRRADPGSPRSGALGVAAAQTDRRRRTGGFAQRREVNVHRRRQRRTAKNRRLPVHHAAPESGRGSAGRRGIRPRRYSGLDRGRA